ncbi:MAG TPA: 50S ribosomal protein L11 methyltransferase [Alphaproteobacteria bacterium]|nr:50S ribosomal protein L11 methyltransferase [Alphaproteobacteria bacterium]
MTPEAFVAAQTVVASPPLVPEIALHLASEVTPLWQATEATLARDNLPPPYWAFAWPGGQALARYVLDHRDIVQGRRVLDFAAGSGLVAIAAAKAGASGVTASEIDPFALAAITRNARLNGVRVDIARHDLTAAPPEEWNVVLAGDVCYERPMAERVTSWLRAAAKRGALVLIADPGRAYLPAAGLEVLARYVVPTSRDLEDRSERETRVLRVLP